MSFRAVVGRDLRNQKVRLVVGGGYKTITCTVSSIELLPTHSGCRYRGTARYLGGQYDVLLPVGKRIWQLDRR